MILPAGFVTALFNHVYPANGSTVDIGGITLHADAPSTTRHIYRYAERSNIAAAIPPLWTLKFSFDERVGHLSFGREFVMVYNPYTNVCDLRLGLVKVEKVSGDLDRFEKDMVILKMYQDSWHGVPAGW